MSRKSSVAALLGVVAVSIVFGMIVGGRLNAPAVLHAAPPAATAAFPAATLSPERTRCTKLWVKCRSSCARKFRASS